jgi:ABC-type uncharacterized transport system permease subunit
MDFLIQWLCYLLAFVAGTAVACVIASVAVKRGANEHVSVNVGNDGAGEGR